MCNSTNCEWKWVFLQPNLDTTLLCSLLLCISWAILTGGSSLSHCWPPSLWLNFESSVFIWELFCHYSVLKFIDFQFVKVLILLTMESVYGIVISLMVPFSDFLYWKIGLKFIGCWSAKNLKLWGSMIWNNYNLMFKIFCRRLKVKKRNDPRWFASKWVKCHTNYQGWSLNASLLIIYTSGM